MSVKLEVWGDYACFTRPEFKVERVSYDVITPSAARGILEALYWHPGVKWYVKRIQVCNPISFTSIRRNEVKCKINGTNVLSAASRNQPESLWLATPQVIQQRSALVLRDVRYIIEADFTIARDCETHSAKVLDIITKRIRRGSYYHQPYFGTREFPAYFKPFEGNPSCPDELKGTRDLGWMLFDFNFNNKEDIRPKFFRATMKDGVIEVPNMYNRNEVLE